MEKERLLTVRVAENSPVAQAAACVSGQNIAGAPTLADLLRRPHVHYSLLAEHGHGAEEIGRAPEDPTTPLRLTVPAAWFIGLTFNPK